MRAVSRCCQSVVPGSDSRALDVPFSVARAVSSVIFPFSHSDCFFVFFFSSCRKHHNIAAFVPLCLLETFAAPFQCRVLLYSDLNEAHFG